MRGACSASNAEPPPEIRQITRSSGESPAQPAADGALARSRPPEQYEMAGEQALGHEDRAAGVEPDRPQAGLRGDLPELFDFALAQDLVDAPPRIDPADGCFTRPDRPGLGDRARARAGRPDD